MHGPWLHLPPSALRWLAAGAGLLLATVLYAGSAWLELTHPLSAVFLGFR